MTLKHKRRLRKGRSRYLKPGALAQLRYNRVTTRSCTEIGKKRVVLLDSREENVQLHQTMVVNHTPISTLKKTDFCPIIEATDGIEQQKPPETPKTPQISLCNSESRLESLPMDILVKILCLLHHDQLRSVFHVSERIRKAVLIARQWYFNYTTPDRSWQEMLSTKTPLPTEHCPFVSKGDGKGFGVPSPHTPKAPRHGPRPPSRLNMTDMRQIAAVLFQESAFPLRHMVRPGLPKPSFKSLASNRVLFYEDVLCQAVAQNKLH